jgi:hypothetical protein
VSSQTPYRLLSGHVDGFDDRNMLETVSSSVEVG